MGSTAQAGDNGAGAARTESGLDAARITSRSAGYCVLCDRIVEITAQGTCSDDESHPAEAIFCRTVLAPDEPVPRLPGFNLAAFLIPPIWGPANGQWAGAIFLPIWLFADSAVASVGRGGAVSVLGAVAVSVATVAAQAWFGKRANGVVWRRVCHAMDTGQFARRQRVWAVAAVPIWLLIASWAVYYRLADSL